MPSPHESSKRPEWMEAPTSPQNAAAEFYRERRDVLLREQSLLRRALTDLLAAVETDIARGYNEPQTVRDARGQAHDALRRTV